MSVSAASAARPGARSASSRVLGGILALAIATAAAPAVFARPAPDSFADLAEQVSPAVVNISTVQEMGPAFTGQRGGPQQSPFPEGHPMEDLFKRFFRPDAPGAPFGMPESMPGAPGQVVRGVGSGFIIDPDGLVVTNNHVIAQAHEIKVTLTDGKVLDAELVGRDERTDLALLRVESDRPLPAVEWGDSDRIRVGDWILAVGNPYGLGGSVTAGIVSARSRDLRAGALNDFLQIDAPINRGNSGGPTFDPDGRVIGVNTAIYSPNGGSVGIGFAIPSNVAAKVVAALQRDGSIERGWLGVSIQEVTPDIATGFRLDRPRGALVAGVQPNGPAAEAGLEPGDIVTSWNGHEVEELKDLPRLVADTPVGGDVEVGLWRKGEAISIVVETGRMPSQEAAAASPQQPGRSEDPGASAVALEGTGISIANLDDQLRRRLQLGGEAYGVVIAEVAAGSVAEEQGLRAGDLIVDVGLEPAADVETARAAFEQQSRNGGSVIALRVSRGGAERFVALRVQAQDKEKLG